MSTTFPILDNKSFKTSANLGEIQNSYAEITRALRSEIEYILFTGKDRKEKSKFLLAMTKDIPASHSLIFLREQDLSFSRNLIKSNTYSKIRKDEKTYIYDFDLLIDFIIESIKLNKNLIIILDDADSLPVEKLTALFNTSLNHNSENNTIQIILAGLPKVLKNLQTLNCFTTQNIIHFSIDGLDDETIRPSFMVEKNKDKLGVSDFEYNQNIFKDRADLENPRFQVLGSIFSRFSNPVREKQYESNVNDFDYNQNIFKDRADLGNAKLPDLRIIFNRFSSFTKKCDISGIIKSIIAGSKSSTHKFAKYVVIFISIIYSTIKILIRSCKLVIKKLLGRTRNIATVFAKGYDFLINVLAKHTKKVVAKFKSKIETAKNIRFSVKSTSGWNITSAAMALVVFVVLLISYRIQPNNNELEGRTDSKLAVDDSSSTFLESPASFKENKKVPLKEDANKIDKELNTIVAKLSNEIPADKESSIVEIKEIIELQADTSYTDLELDKLLYLASQQLEAKKLTTPAGDNAYETYQFILFTRPNHPGAREGLKKIHSKYTSWANRYLQKNDLERARKFFNKALIIEPHNQVTQYALEDLNKEKDSNTDRVNLLLLTKSEPKEVQAILNKANEKLMKIEADIALNKRDYRMFLDTQLTYKKILKRYPNSHAAIAGLIMLKNHYLAWVELEAQNKKYNSSKFLNKQAQSLRLYIASVKQDAKKLQVTSYEEIKIY